MKASDLIAPVIEPVANRYDREYLELNDDRKIRTFDYKSAERRSREFVDPATVAVTTTETVENGFHDTEYTVTGTVTERYDNFPTGFDAQDFEARLVYNPNDANPEDGTPEDQDPAPTP